ncbi:uncharacterized protein CTRU02_203068 [Colletotrichum truncatum]|uniref:Uncharacterized protein n=1 Tax=Colletotrichum truncatum TaxID=5467 RepID=A0ACC3Z8F9_COLTU|nr:uncharacterized protein CTRU02_08906 [Colletotrichum truncatum]KAF6789114.1 hypothetical protein CTRU02_08906 [Colletotrichum truncatum]
MHFPTIVAALGHVSLISAYTARYSKNYCEQTRPVVTSYSNALNYCYNIDGAASLQFTDVGVPSRWKCIVYAGSGCTGSHLEVVSTNSGTNCFNSPVGWIYSYACIDA